MLKKKLTVMLAGVIAVTSMTVSAFGASFNDTAGHWGEAAIERWADADVLHGSNGSFNPDSQMTVAELAQTISNLMNLKDTAPNTFSDVPSNAWYADAINKCAAAGYILGDGNGKASPLTSISRERATVIMARALGIEPTGATVTDFADSGSISSWAAGYIDAMSKAGYINGVGSNKFAPKNQINRASIATILNNTVTTYANKSGSTVTASGSGITLVVAGDVTIEGNVNDLIISQGAADGTVTLENATVTGNVTVNGSGTTLTLSGNTTVNTISISADAEGAKVFVGALCEVKSISVAAESTSIEVAGKVTTISVAATAENTAITALEGGEITTISNKATGLTVSGDGTVTTVTSTTAAITVTTKGTTVNITGSSSSTTGTTSSGGSTGGGTTPSSSAATAYTFAPDTAKCNGLGTCGTISYYEVRYDDDGEYVDEDSEEEELGDDVLKPLDASTPLSYATADEVPDQLRIVFKPLHPEVDLVEDVAVYVDGEEFTEFDEDDYWDDGCVEIHLYKEDIVAKGYSNWTFAANFRDASNDVYTFVTTIKGGTATLYDGTDLDPDVDVNDQTDKLTDDKILTDSTFKYADMPKTIVVKVQPSDSSYVVDEVGIDWTSTDEKSGGAWLAFENLAEEILDNSPFCIKVSNPQFLFGAGTYTLKTKFVSLFDTSTTTGTYNLSADTSVKNGSIKITKTAFDSIADMADTKIYFQPDAGYVLDSVTVQCPGETADEAHNITLDTEITPLAGNGVYTISKDTAFLKDVAEDASDFTWKISATFKPVVSEKNVTTAYAILPDTEYQILTDNGFVQIHTAVKFAEVNDASSVDNTFVQYLGFDTVPNEIWVIATAPKGYEVTGLSVYRDGAPAADIYDLSKIATDLNSGNGSYLFVLDKSIFDKAGTYYIGPLVDEEPKG
jgi:ferredoxin